MAGKGQIAYRRFAHIPAEGDRTSINTHFWTASSRDRKNTS